MLLHWLKSLFKDELLVFVHPQRVVLVRLSRTLNNGLKQKLEHKQVINLTKNIDDVSQIAALVHCLRQAMSNKLWQGAMPTMIVSNSFARYTVIPWDIELAVASERQAYLQHFFNLAYGEQSKKWHLLMSEPVFGQAAIASGMNRDLLQALHNVFAESNVKIAAVYPQLMLAINQTLSEVKKQSLSRGKDDAFSFWLVAIQSGRVCLTLLENGGWRTVKNENIENDVSEQVSALIQRELVHCNLNFDAPVLVYWPESSSDQPLKLPNRKAIKVMPHQFDVLNRQVVSSLSSWASS